MSRVLLVDDEASITRAVGRLLRGAGFEVESAPDAFTALQLLAEKPFSVIIADERMPGTSGVELLETCAREHSLTTRILLTGFADPHMAAEAVNRAEIFRLLWKPWSDDELVAITRQAAWKHELAREAEAMALTPPPAPPMLLRVVGGTDA